MHLASSTVASTAFLGRVRKNINVYTEKQHVCLCWSLLSHAVTRTAETDKTLEKTATNRRKEGRKVGRERKKEKSTYQYSKTTAKKKKNNYPPPEIDNWEMGDGRWEMAGAMMGGKEEEASHMSQPIFHFPFSISPQ